MTDPPAGLRLTTVTGGVAFAVHVTPRARRPGVGGVHDGALRVAVSAPPTGGRANGACVRALAEALGVRPSEVEVDPGSKSRRKRVRVRGPADELTRRLLALASQGELR